jgi:hypothetical protein
MDAQSERIGHLNTRATVRAENGGENLGQFLEILVNY